MLFIFDMGGVVACCTNVIPAIAGHLEISEGKFFQISGEDWMSLLCGRINVQQFWSHFSRKIHRDIKRDLFKTYFHPILNQEVIAIIRDLKKNFRIVCGTNTVRIHYQIHLKQGDYSIFDHVYASHLLGIAKPDPRFYQYIIDKENTTKVRTIFIDDTLENVTAAQSMGIRSIHFVDRYSLKNELIKFQHLMHEQR